jgi:hypothetical protein
MRVMHAPQKGEIKRKPIPGMRLVGRPATLCCTGFVTFVTLYAAYLQPKHQPRSQVARIACAQPSRCNFEDDVLEGPPPDKPRCEGCNKQIDTMLEPHGFAGAAGAPWLCPACLVQPCGTELGFKGAGHWAVK